MNPVTYPIDILNLSQNLPSTKFNIAPENGWLGDYSFLWNGLFSGAVLAPGMVGFRDYTLFHLAVGETSLKPRQTQLKGGILLASGI